MYKCSSWKVSASAIFFAVSLLAGCGGGGSDDTICTTEARTSVRLTVVDESDSAVADASVSYQVDGGEVQLLPCGPTGVCNIAYEVRGTFSISASKPGFAPASATATVTGDVCHVDTQTLKLILLDAL